MNGGLTWAYEDELFAQARKTVTGLSKSTPGMSRCADADSRAAPREQKAVRLPSVKISCIWDFKYCNY